MHDSTSKLRPSAVAAACALLALSPALVGCSKRAPEQTAAPSAAAKSPLPAPAPVAEVTAPSPAATQPMLAHLSPAWGKHGRLPKGIGIPVGQIIPDVAGTDTDGQSLRLLEYAKRGPLVLLFYRGGFCGFANHQLRSMFVRAHQFDALGVPFIMISPDSPEQVAATKRAHALKWPMLSDADLTIIKAFKLTHAVTEPELGEMKRYEMQPPAGLNGAPAILSNPAVFVLDEQGRVKFAHANTNPEMMLAPDQILDGIKTSGVKTKAASAPAPAP